ncbi:hypothetical protein FRC09_005037 [Ceratobasidium sp. 395]|nr:hypothetical protein FRC09_005037 [Ceratobasidium sp. 395]
MIHTRYSLSWSTNWVGSGPVVSMQGLTEPPTKDSDYGGDGLLELPPQASLVTSVDEDTSMEEVGEMEGTDGGVVMPQNEREVYTYHDMGGYLATFADLEPISDLDDSTSASTSFTSHLPDAIQDGMSDLAEPNLTQITSVPITSLPQIAPSTSPVSSHSTDLNTLLMDNFGAEWDLYYAQHVLQTVTGHHAILGARLFEQVVSHFGVMRSEPVRVDGLEISYDSIANWMKTTVNTIQNWRTTERRRVQALVRLQALEQREARHIQMERVLTSLEGPAVNAQVAKLKALNSYLTLVEARQL